MAAASSTSSSSSLRRGETARIAERFQYACAHLEDSVDKLPTEPVTWLHGGNTQWSQLPVANKPYRLFHLAKHLIHPTTHRTAINLPIEMLGYEEGLPKLAEELYHTTTLKTAYIATHPTLHLAVIHRLARTVFFFMTETNEGERARIRSYSINSAGKASLVSHIGAYFCESSYNPSQHEDREFDAYCGLADNAIHDFMDQVNIVYGEKAVGPRKPSASSKCDKILDACFDRIERVVNSSSTSKPCIRLAGACGRLEKLLNKILDYLDSDSKKPVSSYELQQQKYWQEYHKSLKDYPFQ